MERHDRAPVGTFFVERTIVAGERFALGEGAAHHARVKRVSAGDRVRLTNGSGTRGDGVIEVVARGELTVEVVSVETVVALRPITLFVPVADRDRMLWLAEKATELGITKWQAVKFRRSLSVSPRGEGAAFAEKVRARMVSALEQSGGAWLPVILPETSVDRLAESLPLLPILLDAEGGALRTVTVGDDVSEASILVGPEGGLEVDELSSLVAAGWRRVRLAENTLRFETAGVAAVAALRAYAHSDKD